MSAGSLRVQGRRWHAPRRMWVAALLLVAVALILIVQFWRSPVTIRYEVVAGDGGQIPVTVSYVLPSGSTRTEEGQTPWESESLDFRRGDVLRVRAEARDVEVSQIQCRLVSGNAEDGTWVEANIESPPSLCGTAYELGQWPPDDNTSQLIRVG